MMADEELKTVADVASEKAKSEAAAASAETSKALKTVGTWAAAFIDKPAPALPVLLARKMRGTCADPLVDPQDAWMPAGRLGIVASPGGKGKTALLMHLAGHVAAGGKWCGLDVVLPGAVAIVLGEEDLGECHRRLQRAWEHMTPKARQDAAARTLVLPLAGTGDNRLVLEPHGAPVEKSPRAEELVAYLQAEAPPGGWRLVVVDPFARFAGMNAETDNASATSTMTTLEELTKLPGDPTVLVAHHTRKRGKDEGGMDLVELVRGASAIKDAARWVAMLDADPPGEDGKGRATLRVVKSNYTSTAFGLELETMYGVPTGGRPRLAAELDAEADVRKNAAAVAAAEKKKAADAEKKKAADAEKNAVANGRRLGPGNV